MTHGEIVTHYYPMIVQVVSDVLRESTSWHKDNVDEICQDVCVKLLSGTLDRYDVRRGTHGAYIVVVARNLAHNWLRRACRSMEHVDADVCDSMPARTPTPVDAAYRRSQVDALRVALAALTSAERTHVRLIALGTTGVQIAATLKCTNVAVSRTKKAIVAKLAPLCA
jgi:RNA polymerase sigma factor (sigma-70 family)